MNFDRFASDYTLRAVIQETMAKRLGAMLCAPKDDNILDLGCGSGAFYKSLSYIPKSFYGVDLASSMLKLHPKGDNIRLKIADFDEPLFWDECGYFDTIASCGALQWSKDMDSLFANIANHASIAYLAIFTTGTLASIRAITKQDTFLKQPDVLDTLAKKHFLYLDSFVVKYRLYFNDKPSMFRHLKLTGVHFGKHLDYRDAKKLFNEYPLAYLEFETWFCKASKNSFSAE